MLSAPSTLARLAGLLLLCGATPSALALRPRATSPCDYYAQKTVGGNTAADQTTLMALVLHSALLGPFSKYNNVSVPNFVGALTPTMWEGESTSLLPYFDGGYVSTNRGGKAVALNLLDDGGLDALRQLKPSNGNSSSQQDTWVKHVYQYFGTFLQCSHIGSPELLNYQGQASMYEVHKFMDLNKAEMGYFIDQATRGLLSFGFEDADAQSINMTLTSVFNLRCAKAQAVVPADAPPSGQAICIAPDCALADNATCSAYADPVAPAVADAALVGNYTKAANGSTSFTASSTTGASSPTTPAKSGSGAPATTGAVVAGGAWAALVAMGLMM